MTMKILWFIALSGLLCVIGFCEEARYDNYRVYEVSPENLEHIKILESVKESSDSYIFLNSAHRIGDVAHIIVAPHKFADFTSVLSDSDIAFRLVDNDLQKSINDQKISYLSKKPRKVDWTNYNTLDEIHGWLDLLAEKYPANIKVLVAGKSYENRLIKGVKLSYKEGNPGIFIEGGIHAREWISPATVTYILNQLLVSKDSSVRNIAENFDWYIFPNANPDGYAYTFSTNRLWRKTRTPYGSCYGADPNRNWDFHWREVGASSQVCSETYAGPSPFSEVETKALSNFVTSIRDKLHAYISFHAYSQLLLYPYGHTSMKTYNHNDLTTIALATAKALARRYGTRYKVGNTYDAIYPASGASMDWAFGVHNISVSYTYELRPSGNSWNGFELPPRQIIPTGEETLDSLVALVETAKKLGYYYRK